MRAAPALLLALLAACDDTPGYGVVGRQGVATMIVAERVERPNCMVRVWTERQ
jgi:hypothetical protein